jgi:hypothetical protein
MQNFLRLRWDCGSRPKSVRGVSNAGDVGVFIEAGVPLLTGADGFEVRCFHRKGLR